MLFELRIDGVGSYRVRSVCTGAHRQSNTEKYAILTRRALQTRRLQWTTHLCLAQTATSLDL